MKIEYLASNKKYIPLVAGWIYKEFVKDIRTSITEKQIQNILKLTTKNKLPITLIATQDNKCVGTISIFKNDLKTLNYTPWLGSLYVSKEYRNRGIAKLLINRVIEISRNMGYSILYLRTEHASDYYIKHGWKYYMTTIDDIEQETNIFVFNL